jgi:protein SCO1/2
MKRGRSVTATLRGCRGRSLCALILLSLTIAGGPPAVAGEDSPLVRGGPFALLDQRGASVTQNSFPGRFLLLFFGYTRCPDVCPTGLAVMSRSIELLGEKATRVQPIFITFDPARDTVERLAEYLRYFDPRIVGLTGSKQQTLLAANHYGVDVSATYASSQPGSEYSMNHSAFTYLVAPDGVLRMMFRDAITPTIMAASIRKALDRWDAEAASP